MLIMGFARKSVSLLLLVCGFVLAQSLILAAYDGRHWTRLAAEQICPIDDFSGFDPQRVIEGSALSEARFWPDERTPRRVMARIALPDYGELTVEWRNTEAQLLQFRAAYDPGASGPDPAFQIIADGLCAIRSARSIRGGSDPWVYLDFFAPDLETLRGTETLQAPWPGGSDPSGVRVALVDSGLAYDLAMFRDRLARDENGTPLGYDFWDLDPWPYDADMARGPFLPFRHGTTVASVLAREAPDAAIIPFRYPRPDMARMAGVVDRAADAGARILALPLGSKQRDDWISFEQALQSHDILAIISAGNNGIDIDQNPIYPAALDLPQILTVTSSEVSGQLADRSNWGAVSVDLMLPAENIEVTDFRGDVGVGSGSSYAVPRLAALAARILAAEPDLSATELKARLIARATPAPSTGEAITRHGWIKDPLAD